MSNGGDDKRIASGPPRYLDRDLGHGDYTHNRARAAPSEGECLTPAEQEAMSLRARRAWVERRRLAWREARATIDDVLAKFSDGVASDRAVLREVRQVKRGLDRVSRCVAH